MLIFDKSTESYRDTTVDVPLTRVSNLLTSVSPKFDADFWSKKKALELNTTQKAILEKWKNINETACAHGTKVHDELENSVLINDRDIKREATTSMTKKQYIENMIRTNSTGSLLNELVVKYPAISVRLHEYFNDGWIPFPELRLHDINYFRLVGTIDLPLFKLFPDGTIRFRIVDYKTNKELLKFKSGYYRKVNNLVTDKWVDKDERFLAPLQHIQFCKGNVYKFQLNLYRFLIEINFGYICEGLEIFQMPFGSNKVYHYPIEQDTVNTKLLLKTLKNG